MWRYGLRYRVQGGEAQSICGAVRVQIRTSSHSFDAARGVTFLPPPAGSRAGLPIVCWHTHCSPTDVRAGIRGGFAKQASSMPSKGRRGFVNTRKETPREGCKWKS
jgi:hypothetical protein